MTLIELLIVVAIIAILAAGMISYVVIPPREQVQATSDMENETGLGGLFAKLVADAHNATTLTLAHGGRALILKESAPEASAVYFVDGKGGLRRALVATQRVKELIGKEAETNWKEPAPASLLAANVRRFDAAPLGEGPLWRIRLELETKSDPLRPTLERSVDLLPGGRR
jgi:prepilin-type N-terminal cleavage/methylation domain-containing protein